MQFLSFVWSTRISLIPRTEPRSALNKRKRNSQRNEIPLETRRPNKPGYSLAWLGCRNPFRRNRMFQGHSSGGVLDAVACEKRAPASGKQRGNDSRIIYTWIQARSRGERQTHTRTHTYIGKESKRGAVEIVKLVKTCLLAQAAR